MERAGAAGPAVLAEIRSPKELYPPAVDVDEQEIEGALALMDTMARDDLQGPEFRDEYTEAMAKIIEAKREHYELPKAPEPEQPAQVLDLMAALNASVEQAKASRDESTGQADIHEIPKPKKNAAAKKQTAKKAEAKKAAAKKGTGRRPRSA
ncbi:hypothetical protein GCM10010339_82260 [Streptomyces alanosinicus]|uniref:Ku domain-containing protein n=1 Tax=Streptomyces alanosinicus TaxID=68171 RepID=A0A918YRG0_9ACTN|nr:hypothetical protein GCM10010339_82260 [Streptomyces alanosinicus]